MPNILSTRSFAMACSFLSGSAMGTAKRVKQSMITRAHALLSSVGDTEFVLYSTRSIETR